MTRKPSTARLFGLALLLATAPPPGAQAALPDIVTDRWQRVETPHFTLFTNGGATTATQVGRRLERLAEVLGITARGLKLRSHVPTYVYVFSSNASFGPYKTVYDGKPANEDGHFAAGFQANYIALHCESVERAIEVAQHEFIHCVLANTVPRGLPLWLDEGLAEFYSTFTASQRTADIGRLVPEHAAVLSSRQEMPLARLFTMAQNSPDYHVADRQELLYAESWGVVHFLVMADQEGRFGRLVTRLRNGADPALTFSAVYGTNLDSLDRAFASYLGLTSLPYRKLTFDEDLETVPVRSTPMTSAEVLYRLGDLLAHDSNRPSTADAERHLVESCRRDPGNAAALATLGLVHQRAASSETDSARRAWHAAQEDSCFARSLALAPADPQPYLVAARTKLDAWLASQPSMSPGDVTPALALEARGFAERGLAIAPSHPELLAAYGMTFLCDRAVPSDAIGALMDAADALPARSDLFTSLLVLYCNLDNPKAARGLYQARLRDRASPVEQLHASLAIANAELRKAARLLKESQRDEAIALLEQAAAEAESAEARKALERALEQARGR